MGARRIAVEFEISDQPQGQPEQFVPPVHLIVVVPVPALPDCAIEIPEQECG